jgi:hypothetical protein
VQVLDDDGRVVDGAEAPDLEDDDLVEMYRHMRLARHFDERASRMLRYISTRSSSSRSGTSAPSTTRPSSSSTCTRSRGSRCSVLMTPSGAYGNCPRPAA